MQEQEYELLDDLENGELRLVSVDGEWLVGRQIEHKFQSGDDGEV